LVATSESNQRHIFCSLGNLPTFQQVTVYRGAVSRTAIHARVLADALPETSNGIKQLEISGLKIGSRSEVEQLARGLKTRVESLAILILEDIVLDVEDKTGFLDPILLALALVPGQPRGRLSWFSLSCAEAAANGASVVSPEALGAFFADEPIETPMRYFLLNNVGLNDNHCEAIAQELARDDALLRPIDELDLTGNPSIGQQGFEAPPGLLYQRANIGAVVVDDQNWSTTFDILKYMNRACHRGRFLENGFFSLRVVWVNFLVELASTDYY
jgi:hypothetical protein